MKYEVMYVCKNCKVGRSGRYAKNIFFDCCPFCGYKEKRCNYFEEVGYWKTEYKPFLKFFRIKTQRWIKKGDE